MSLYFISGKGGVGKTQLSLSLAMCLADRGEKTVLVDFSKNNLYSEFFEESISFIPTSLAENLWVATWSGENCLREYAKKILKSDRAVEYLFKNKMLQNLIELAPGLKEIAVLGKATSDYRESQFQSGFKNIIFDSPSSGHFISLLNTPNGLLDIVKSGRMGAECQSIKESLINHKEIKFFLVKTESLLSKNETIESSKKIEEILEHKKEVQVITNFSEEFPDLSTASWIETAQQLSKHWEKLL